jgi:methyl-accepting chemotaxis protein
VEGRLMNTAFASSPPAAPSSDTLVRWLWIWITLGILVAVVVIGFLIGIVRALNVINGGLFEAASSVTAIGHDADPLPGSLQSINTNLSGIDGSLKPLSGQATDLGVGVSKIRDALKLVDGSLKNASGALASTDHKLAPASQLVVGIASSTGDISRSLADTTNILESVHDLTGRIRDTLWNAERASSLGTAGTLNQVNRVNEILRPVQGDTHTITRQLDGVNQNLTAICQSPLLLILPPQACGR